MQIQGQLFNTNIRETNRILSSFFPSSFRNPLRPAEWELHNEHPAGQAFISSTVLMDNRNSEAASDSQMNWGSNKTLAFHKSKFKAMFWHYRVIQNRTWERNLHNQASQQHPSCQPFPILRLFLCSFWDCNRAFYLENKSGGSLESEPKVISQRAWP